MNSLKPVDKQDVRIRLPVWVYEKLERAALDAGINKNPVPNAIEQILTDWARNFDG